MADNVRVPSQGSFLSRLLDLRGSSDLNDIKGLSEQRALWLRIAMAVAMFSVSLENNQEIHQQLLSRFTPTSLSNVQEALVILLAAVLVLNPKYTRLGVIVFAVASIPNLPKFFGLANHQILGLYCILPAVLFKDWVTSVAYANYMRITFGMVMLAACAQKLVAGTYVDGSYLYYLITSGDTTTKWFGFICTPDPSVRCVPIVVASNFILIWQAIVGVFLIIGWKNIVVLIVEIGFLLGAGVFADEFNFQVLNIALLTIVFRVGVPIAGAIPLIVITIADLWGLGTIGTQLQMLFTGGS
jgi:hypothetical protein